MKRNQNNCAIFEIEWRRFKYATYAVISVVYDAFGYRVLLALFDPQRLHEQESLQVIQMIEKNMGSLERDLLLTQIGNELLVNQEQEVEFLSRTIFLGQCGRFTQWIDIDLAGSFGSNTKRRAQGSSRSRTRNLSSLS